MLEAIIIYTDGGCDPNPGPGGWAALIIRAGRTEEYSGAEIMTTNNRMELRAVIEGLRQLPIGSDVVLYADSQYVIRGIVEWMPKWLEKNWKRSGGLVANRDLWEALLDVSRLHHIKWRWLEGHSGNRYNERVDRLCELARRKLLREK